MADENTYLIKVTAKDPSTRSFALVCMAVPEDKSGVDRIDAVITHNPETVQVSRASTYRDCKNLMQKMILNGSVTQSSTQSLLNSYKSSFSSESYMIEFQHYLEYSEEEKLKNLIAQNIQKLFNRSEIETVIYFSKIPKSDLDVVSAEKKEKNKEEEEEKKEFPRPSSIPEEALILNYQFVLSPVTGTSVDDLRLGDRIMVKILPDTDDANKVIDELGIKDEQGTVHPCVATIVEILTHESSMEVVVKISENTYGRYFEDEVGIRIKMAEISATEEEEQIIREVVESNERSWFVPAIISFGILTILWVIVAFFIL
ncbi:MAG: hypothetical protein KDK36_16430 [Leptospiraceae bacterium]|nr:hypothetical protein [Leptospiraceae bacterium]